MDLTIIWVFFIGFLASFIGGMVGGGGLISIPFLIFVGLPPQVAVATNKFGSLGGASSVASVFWKKKKIIWCYVLPFSIIAIVGGFIGANILVKVDEKALGKAIGVIILLILPFIFLRRSIGTKRRQISGIRKKVGYLLYFCAMVWGGFFGGGGVVFIFYTLMYFFGFTIIEANATDIIPWLLLSITAVIIFAFNGLINFSYGIILLMGMAIGGYFGAHTAILKGNLWVKGLFAAMVLASGVKLIFF
ncbi:MAG: sulfite exporter TauE/SafE family protein [Nanoarchaeota archaeon]|nr:sulfite exporter TauE/SafE family protein [Nanoarchaeota archaeon]